MPNTTVWLGFFWVCGLPIGCQFFKTTQTKFVVSICVSITRLCSVCLARVILLYFIVPGAPVLLSNPHFYGASENYRSGVIGLNPNKDLHQSFLDLEPTTGVPLQGKRRIQVNVDAKKRTDVKLLRNHVDAVIPMMWIDEGASLGDKEISLLKDQLLFVLNIENIARWTLFSVGILFLVIGVSLAAIRKRQEDSDIYDLNED